MMRSTVLALFCVFSGIVGCSTEVGSEGSNGSSSKSAAGKTAQGATRWNCETHGKEVVCTGAAALSAGEAPAYACKPGEVSDKCPDQTSVEKCDGIGELGGSGALENSPWACVLTGGSQANCIKQVGAEEGGEGKPTPPESCDVGEWQKYFGEQASYEYQKAGVDITFPAEIFDANQSIVEAALGGAGPGGMGGVPGAGGGIPGIPGGGGIPGMPGGGGVPGAGGGDDSTGEGGGGGDAPSCHTGEWAMRMQSWLDVVMKGCAGQLAMANTVWCQQAANYAPTTNKCTATGTW
jgi:hypothetical protein